MQILTVLQATACVLLTVTTCDFLTDPSSPSAFCTGCAALSRLSMNGSKWSDSPFHPPEHCRIAQARVEPNNRVNDSCSSGSSLCRTEKHRILPRTPMIRIKCHNCQLPLQARPMWSMRKMYLRFWALPPPHFIGTRWRACDAACICVCTCFVLFCFALFCCLFLCFFVYFFFKQIFHHIADIFSI